MTRGSNPPTPAQWNLHGWMTSYYESQRAIPVPQKAEEMEDIMQGGWKFEGKARPVSPRICIKCQGGGEIRQEDQTKEPDRNFWCEDCQEGKSPPGHVPEGIKPSVVLQD